MRSMVVLLFAVSLYGCGGGEDIEGTWGLDLSMPNYPSTGANTPCTYLVTFKGSAFEQDLLCGSGNAEVMQTYVGTYSVTGNQLTTVDTKSTCPDPNPTSTVTFTLEGDQLTIVETSGGVLVFIRVTVLPASRSDALATLGCFSSDDTTFTPGPLNPI
ncbi:MAG: hypothetical protein WBP56_25375 [Polyangia bacterium]|jgi:hypothetical protein